MTEQKTFRRVAIFNKDGICVQCARIEEPFADQFVTANTPAGGMHIELADGQELVAGRHKRLPDGRIAEHDPHANVKYQVQRRAEYPAIGDQLDALWKLVGSLGAGTPESDAILTQIQAIKARYPKS